MLLVVSEIDEVGHLGGVIADELSHRHLRTNRYLERLTKVVKIAVFRGYRKKQRGQTTDFQNSALRMDQERRGIRLQFGYLRERV